MRQRARCAGGTLTGNHIWCHSRSRGIPLLATGSGPSPSGPEFLHIQYWVVGGWRLAVGGGWWLVTGGWWRLAVIGG